MDDLEGVREDLTYNPSGSRQLSGNGGNSGPNMHAEGQGGGSKPKGPPNPSNMPPGGSFSGNPNPSLPLASFPYSVHPYDIGLGGGRFGSGTPRRASFHPSNGGFNSKSGIGGSSSINPSQMGSSSQMTSASQMSSLSQSQGWASGSQTIQNGSYGSHTHQASMVGSIPLETVSGSGPKPEQALYGSPYVKAVMLNLWDFSSGPRTEQIWTSQTSPTLSQSHSLPEPSSDSDPKRHSQKTRKSNNPSSRPQSSSHSHLPSSSQRNRDEDPIDGDKGEIYASQLAEEISSKRREISSKDLEILSLDPTASKPHDGAGGWKMGDGIDGKQKNAHMPISTSDVRGDMIDSNIPPTTTLLHGPLSSHLSGTADYEPQSSSSHLQAPSTKVTKHILHPAVVAAPTSSTSPSSSSSHQPSNLDEMLNRDGNPTNGLEVVEEVLNFSEGRPSSPLPDDSEYLSGIIDENYVANKHPPLSRNALKAKLRQQPRVISSHPKHAKTNLSLPPSHLNQSQEFNTTLSTEDDRDIILSPREEEANQIPPSFSSNNTSPSLTTTPSPSIQSSKGDPTSSTPSLSSPFNDQETSEPSFQHNDPTPSDQDDSPSQTVPTSQPIRHSGESLQTHQTSSETMSSSLFLPNDSSDDTMHEMGSNIDKDMTVVGETEEGVEGEEFYEKSSSSSSLSSYDAWGSDEEDEDDDNDFSMDRGADEAEEGEDMEFKFFRRNQGRFSQNDENEERFNGRDAHNDGRYPFDEDIDGSEGQDDEFSSSPSSSSSFGSYPHPKLSKHSTSQNYGVDADEYPLNGGFEESSFIDKSGSPMISPRLYSASAGGRVSNSKRRRREKEKEGEVKRIFKSGNISSISSFIAKYTLGSDLAELVSSSSSHGMNGDGRSAGIMLDPWNITSSSSNTSSSSSSSANQSHDGASINPDGSHFAQQVMSSTMANVFGGSEKSEKSSHAGYTSGPGFGTDEDSMGGFFGGGSSMGGAGHGPVSGNFNSSVDSSSTNPSQGTPSSSFGSPSMLPGEDDEEAVTKLGVEHKLHVFEGAPFFTLSAVFTAPYNVKITPPSAGTSNQGSSAQSATIQSAAAMMGVSSTFPPSSDQSSNGNQGSTSSANVSSSSSMPTFAADPTKFSFSILLPSSSYPSYLRHQHAIIDRLNQWVVLYVYLCQLRPQQALPLIHKEIVRSVMHINRLLACEGITLPPLKQTLFSMSKSHGVPGHGSASINHSSGSSSSNTHFQDPNQSSFGSGKLYGTTSTSRSQAGSSTSQSSNQTKSTSSSSNQGNFSSSINSSHGDYSSSASPPLNEGNGSGFEISGFEKSILPSQGPSHSHSSTSISSSYSTSTTYDYQDSDGRPLSQKNRKRSGSSTFASSTPPSASSGMQAYNQGMNSPNMTMGGQNQGLSQHFSSSASFTDPSSPLPKTTSPSPSSHPYHTHSGTEGASVNPETEMRRNKDFLSLILTSHFQTHQRTVIMGDDIDMVNLYVSTVSLFLSPEDRMRSRYATYHNIPTYLGGKQTNPYKVVSSNTGNKQYGNVNASSSTSQNNTFLSHPHFSLPSHASSTSPSSTASSSGDIPLMQGSGYGKSNQGLHHSSSGSSISLASHADSTTISSLHPIASTASVVGQASNQQQQRAAGRRNLKASVSSSNLQSGNTSVEGGQSQWDEALGGGTGMATGGVTGIEGNQFGEGIVTSEVPIVQSSSSGRDYNPHQAQSGGSSVAMSHQMHQHFFMDGFVPDLVLQGIHGNSKMVRNSAYIQGQMPVTLVDLNRRLVTQTHPFHQFRLLRCEFHQAVLYKLLRVKKTNLWNSQETLFQTVKEPSSFIRKMVIEAMRIPDSLILPFISISLNNIMARTYTLVKYVEGIEQQQLQANQIQNTSSDPFSPIFHDSIPPSSSSSPYTTHPPSHSTDPLSRRDETHNTKKQGSTPIHPHLTSSTPQNHLQSITLADAQLAEQQNTAIQTNPSNLSSTARTSGSGIVSSFFSSFGGSSQEVPSEGTMRTSEGRMQVGNQSEGQSSSSTASSSSQNNRKESDGTVLTSGRGLGVSSGVQPLNQPLQPMSPHPCNAYYSTGPTVPSHSDPYADLQFNDAHSSNPRLNQNFKSQPPSPVPSPIPGSTTGSMGLSGNGVLMGGQEQVQLPPLSSSNSLTSIFASPPANLFHHHHHHLYQHNHATYNQLNNPYGYSMAEMRTNPAILRRIRHDLDLDEPCFTVLLGLAELLKPGIFRALFGDPMSQEKKWIELFEGL